MSLTPPGVRCPICQRPLDPQYRFDCIACGRPIGGCADCEWMGRLLENDDLADCEACDFTPLMPEEEERQRPWREHMAAALDRQFEVRKQMMGRSGPIYEIARERGRIISEAYRAAGRPRYVSESRTPDGMAYVHRITRGPRKWQQGPATEAEWRAWRAWCTERERLRQELRHRR